MEVLGVQLLTYVWGAVWARRDVGGLSVYDER